MASYLKRSFILWWLITQIEAAGQIGFSNLFELPSLTADSCLYYSAFIFRRIFLPSIKRDNHPLSLAIKRV